MRSFIPGTIFRHEKNILLLYSWAKICQCIHFGGGYNWFFCNVIVFGSHLVILMIMHRKLTHSSETHHMHYIPEIRIISQQTISYTIMHSETSIYWFLAAIWDCFNNETYSAIPSLVKHLTCMRFKHHISPNPDYRHSHNLICNQAKWIKWYIILLIFSRPSWICLDELICTIPLWWNISHESTACQTPSSRL